jgi:hypothetical protein
LDHLLYVNQPLIIQFNTNWPVSSGAGWILEFWLHILNIHEKPAPVVYDLSYSGEVLSIPYLAIMDIMAVSRATDAIWTSPFQIHNTLDISQLLIYIWTHFD